MPHNLINFHCSNIKITKIQNLPKNLQQFYCYTKEIHKIINLPNNLKIFECSLNYCLIKEKYFEDNHPIKIKFIQFSLKKILIDYLLTNELNNLSEKIPLDLIEEIKSLKKICFHCQKIKPIYCKLQKIHEMWKVSCWYFYCWNCRNNIKN